MTSMHNVHFFTRTVYPVHKQDIPRWMAPANTHCNHLRNRALMSTAQTGSRSSNSNPGTNDEYNPNQMNGGLSPGIGILCGHQQGRQDHSMTVPARSFAKQLIRKQAPGLPVRRS